MAQFFDRRYPLIFFEIDRVPCCTGKVTGVTDGTRGLFFRKYPHIVKIFKNGKILKGVK